MKKKIAMMLVCMMVAAFGACAAETDEESGKQGGTQAEENVSEEEDKTQTQENSNSDEGDSSTEGEAEQEPEQEPEQTALGFRGEVEYKGINLNGTDTDKLAFLAGDTVHIFDFGEGCDMVSQLIMNTSRGTITSKEEDPQLFFTAGGSPRKEATDFGLYREGIHVGFSGIEREGELYVSDDVELITSEDGSYTYVNSWNMKGFYDIAMTPEGGSYPVVVGLSVVDSIETLEATVEWLKTNYKCYKLNTYEDITSAVDVNGNPVDLSSCIFYKDILAKQLKEVYGIVVKDFTVFEDGDSYYYDFKLDTLIEANFSSSLYSEDFTEEDAVDFLGYKAYVVPDKRVYLVCNLNSWSSDGGDVIEFEINPKEKLTTVEETLAYLEDRLFSDKMIGEE